MGNTLYNKRKLKEKDLRLYGIDREEVFKEQGGRCLICCTEFVEPYHKLTHADHSHLTGEFRGLLCQSCNTGLGKFKDNPLFLERAAKYLKESNNVTTKSKENI